MCFVSIEEVSAAKQNTTFLVGLGLKIWLKELNVVQSGEASAMLQLQNRSPWYIALIL